MCDAFGAPSFAIPYQEYEVYEVPGGGLQSYNDQQGADRSKRGPAVVIFGIDRTKQKYCEMRIPKATETPYTLTIEHGVETHSLSELRKNTPRGVTPTLGYGLVGFIQFVQGYYLILITHCQRRGRLGHHQVYCIQETRLIPLFVEPSGQDKKFRDQFSLLKSQDYYFSYTWDLCRSAQQNLADAIRHRLSGSRSPMRRPLYTEKGPNDHRFVWNFFELGPLLQHEALERWCTPIIHGFLQISNINSYGWSFDLVLVARRSRLYAGTRYRKRGLDVGGHVANDVETEQMLLEKCSRLFAKGHIMSFVQMRGSVPLFWAQEATAMKPKPRVVYPRCDPTLSATRKHFQDLFERYGHPPLIVNLMKHKRPDSFEVRLSKNFEAAIERINRELPQEYRMLYRSCDLKYYWKHAEQGVKSFNQVCTDLAQSVVGRVGFFHSYDGSSAWPRQSQCGVVRTNCLDCLDRTNVFQFFVGLEVFKRQLITIGLMRSDVSIADLQQSPASHMFSEMWEMMGDSLAVQYANSKVHKKYPLRGSRPRMMRPEELFTSIHRHYSSSVSDITRQNAMNLFLGIYRPSEHNHYGDVETDSWLHHGELKAVYDPGSWWEQPTNTYMRRVGFLRNQVQPQFGLLREDDDGRWWFNVLHTVWKPTNFDEVESLHHGHQLQVHLPTKHQGPGGSEPVQSLHCLSAAVTKTLQHRKGLKLPKDDHRPNEVPICDRWKYEEFSDRKQLNRCSWQLPSLSEVLSTTRRNPILPKIKDVLIPGEAVTLQSADGALTLSTPTGNDLLVCASNARPETEIGHPIYSKFLVVDAGDGHIALKSMAFNCAVRMESQIVKAGRFEETLSIGNWGHFRAVALGDGCIGLYCTAHSRFLQIAKPGRGHLEASRKCEKPYGDIPDDVKLKIVREGQGDESMDAIKATVARLVHVNFCQALKDNMAAVKSRPNVTFDDTDRRPADNLEQRLQSILQKRAELERGPGPSPPAPKSQGATATAIPIPIPFLSPPAASASALPLPPTSTSSSSSAFVPLKSGGMGGARHSSNAWRNASPAKEPKVLRWSRTPGQPGRAEPPQETLKFCSYCGRLCSVFEPRFAEAPLDTESEDSGAKSQFLVNGEYLCPEHWQKVKSLDTFYAKGSMLPHDQKQQSDGLLVGNVLLRTTPPSGKQAEVPWLNWVTVGPSALDNLPGSTPGARPRYDNYPPERERTRDRAPSGFARSFRSLATSDLATSRQSVEAVPPVHLLSVTAAPAATASGPSPPLPPHPHPHPAAAPALAAAPAPPPPPPSLTKAQLVSTFSVSSVNGPITRGQSEGVIAASADLSADSRGKRGEGLQAPPSPCLPPATTISPPSGSAGAAAVASASAAGASVAPTMSQTPSGSGVVSMPAAAAAAAATTSPMTPTFSTSQAKLRHLRLHVLPCSEPEAPTSAELGVPSWWLDTAKKEPVTKPAPPIRTVFGAEKSSSKKSTAARGAQTPSSLRSKRASTELKSKPASSPSAAGGKLESGEKDQVPEASSKPKSIFEPTLTSKILDELLGEETQQLSPIARTRSTASGHHRARSMM